MGFDPRFSPGTAPKRTLCGFFFACAGLGHEQSARSAPDDVLKTSFTSSSHRGRTQKEARESCEPCRVRRGQPRARKASSRETRRRRVRDARPAVSARVSARRSLASTASASEIEPKKRFRGGSRTTGGVGGTAFAALVALAAPARMRTSRPKAAAPSASGTSFVSPRITQWQRTRASTGR